ncbi:hypothetical protein HGG76_03770 [Ochrobactrum tritici]|uniref:Uncharacterized protein n=1 Tax=Brucella tritici TaxID=94626 RepID=A0A7X6FRB4_9HYPH|nr:hypothetical protein [Brucella tritici]
MWGEALEMTANVTDMPLVRREMTTKERLSRGVIFPVKDAIDFAACLTTFPRSTVV